MKRKNILAVIALVAVFAFAIVGCGSKDKEPTANTAARVFLFFLKRQYNGGLPQYE